MSAPFCLLAKQNLKKCFGPTHPQNDQKRSDTTKCVRNIRNFKSAPVFVPQPPNHEHCSAAAALPGEAAASPDETGALPDAAATAAQTDKCREPTGPKPGYFYVIPVKAARGGRSGVRVYKGGRALGSPNLSSAAGGQA